MGSVLTGKQLDWQYRKDRGRWEAQRRERLGLEKLGELPALTKEEELEFPIEKARLKWALGYTIGVSLLGVGFGWALEKRVTIAVPLVFLFFSK